MVSETEGRSQASDCQVTMPRASALTEIKKNKISGAERRAVRRDIPALKQIADACPHLLAECGARRYCGEECQRWDWEAGRHAQKCGTR